MQKFELYLKNQRTKFNNRFAGLLLGLNFIAIWFVMTKQNYTRLEGKLTGIIGISLMILTFIVQYILILNKKNNHTKKSVLIASISIALYMTFTGYWWIGLIFLALFLLYRVSERELKIIIQHDFIVYPSFPKKKINWSELNNIIVKDGLLTIDLKNNKLIQQNIDEIKTSINEKEFNDFCSQQLKAAPLSI